jgi:hypothetical protein
MSNVPNIANEASSLGDDDLFYVAQSDGYGGYTDAKIKGSKITSGGASQTIMARTKLAEDKAGFPKATVTFSTIDGTYDRLIVKMKARTSNVSGGELVNVKINSDTTMTNYHTQRIIGGNNTADGSEFNDLNRIAIISAANSPTDSWGRATITLEGYTETDATKMVVSMHDVSDIADGVVVGSYAVFWNSTAAITDLEFSTTGNFISGSEFEIWGEKEITVGGGGATQTIMSKVKLDEDKTSFPKTTVTFSTIDGTYDRLIVKMKGRSSEGSASEGISLEINSDSTLANYHTQRIQGGNGTAYGTEYNDFSRVAVVPAALSPADSWGRATMIIEDYAATDTTKLMQSMNDYYPITDGIFTGPYTVHWNSIAAITDLVFSLEAGDFIDGTEFELWGEKEITVLLA